MSNPWTACAPSRAELAAFERTTGIRVDATASLGGIATPGAVGNLSAEEALEALLRGTGVSWRFTAPNVIAVELRRSEVVQVRAEAAPSSVKYTQPLRDIPQTLMVIPQEVIQEQGATTLRDVLQNVPGLTILAGERGNAGRGQPHPPRLQRPQRHLRQRGAGPGRPVPGSLQPGAGRGRQGTGLCVHRPRLDRGSINLVSKSPLARAQHSGSLVLGSDATKRASVDVNQPLHGLGEGAAVRLNVMGHDADVAGRNAVTTRRWGVAPSLAFGMGTPTRVTLSYLKLDQDNVSDYGIPWVPANHAVLSALRNQPAPVPGRRSTASPIATVSCSTRTSRRWSSNAT